MGNIALFAPLLNNDLGADLSAYYYGDERNALDSLHSSVLHYAWVFTVMPLVAAVVLGLVQSVHEKNCETMAMAAKKEADLTVSASDNLLRNSINHE